jgi:hypothetical protein
MKRKNKPAIIDSVCGRLILKHQERRPKHTYAEHPKMSYSLRFSPKANKKGLWFLGAGRTSNWYNWLYAQLGEPTHWSTHNIPYPYWLVSLEDRTQVMVNLYKQFGVWNGVVK